MDALTELDIDALGTRAEGMLRELAAISAEPDRLVRLFLTPEHRRAADLVARFMHEAGLEVSEDALGTVRGRLPAAGETHRRLLIGSHIDTVIDAGRYDGPLGVIAGILAAGHVARRGRLPFGIDVLAFGDEEGSRFPSTLSSSAAVAGVFDPRVLALADRDGITFAQALAAYGKHPQDIAAAAIPPPEAAAYVEVHIEQGPRLEAADLPLGVVTAIAGQSRFRVTITGEAGHAGTVPMALRRDALAAAAEMMLELEHIALAQTADGMVATVGALRVFPGASNVIPGRVELSVDLRSAGDPERRAAVTAFKAHAAEIAGWRHCALAIEDLHEVAGTPCDPALQAMLGKAAAALDLRTLALPSGAGHDGQMMARLCPAAMLFVRCRGGISHNPREFASERDMGLAIATLIGFIERFDPDRLRSSGSERKDPPDP
jgi:allantoate deiminase